jgi:Concanavalin A-like lectin/glucanases superfamily
LLLITVQPLRRSSRSSHGDPRYFQATLANFPATACTVSFWFSGSGTAFFYGDLDTAAPMDATNTPFSVVIDAGVEVRFLVTAGSVHAALPSVTGEHFASVVFEQPAGSATGYVTIYLDGALATARTPITLSRSGPPVAVLGAGNLYVATNPPDFSQDNHIRESDAFTGTVTDLHIWSRAMTAAEVAQDAMATVDGDEPGLYLALPLDSVHMDHSGVQAIDLAPAGQHAKALRIPEDSRYVQYYNSFNTFPTGSRTLEMWIRTGYDDAGTLFSYADNPNSFPSSEQGTAWTIARPGGLTINGVSTGVFAADGQWHHLAVVVDADAATDTVYLDGEQAYQGQRTAVGQIPFQELTVGGQTPDMDDRLCRGQIGAVYLWSAARTADQIFTDSLPVKPQHDATLAGFWSGTAGPEPDITVGGPDAGSGLDDLSPRWDRLAMNSDPHSLVLSSTGTVTPCMTVPAYDIGLDDFTFETWARTGAAGPIVSGASTSTGTASGNAIGLAVAQDGSLVLALWSKATSSRAAYQTAPLGLLGNTWHHVAAIRSAGVLRLVVDGVTAPAAVGTPGQTGTGGGARIDLGSIGLTVGAAGPGTSPVLPAGPSWKGSLAEVRLWNRALLIGEIRGGLHHLLAGDEPGLTGRWGFDHGTGQDRSPTAHHATFTPGVSFSRDLVDLEPRDQPYLVAQSKLMEDYDFPSGTGAITPQRTYRVVVHAHDARGRALPSQPITFSLQAESYGGVSAATLQTHTATGTQSLPLTSSSGQVLTTNAEGVVSAAIVADSLVAPVIRLSAPFMPQGHALLVFPDRHAHYTLSKLTGPQLLGTAPVGTKKQRLLLAGTADTAADPVAKAVSALMSAATEHQVQGSRPMTRTLDTRLAATVTPPPIRDFENGYVSHSAFSAASDVSSGFAVSSSDAISRSVAGTGAPAWMLSTDANGVLSFSNPTTGNNHSARTTGDAAAGDDLKTILAKLNPTPVDDLAAAFAPTGGQGTRSAFSLADLQGMLDNDDKQRSISLDIAAAVAAAATVIVRTVDIALDTAGQVARAVVLVFTEAAGTAKSVVIETVHHAVAAVAGVFQKIGVAVSAVVDFLKELFNWDDILATQQFIEAQLRAVVPYVNQNLASAQAYVIKQLATARQQADRYIAGLQRDLIQRAVASAQSSAAFGQPQDVTSSYVSHLAVSNVSGAVLSPGGTDITPPAASPFADMSGNASYSKLVGHINGLGASVSLGLADILSWFLGVVAEALDDAIGLAQDLVTAIFKAIEAAFAAIDAQLGHRIEIPLVTALYEQVITKGRSTLTFYSVAALLGAAPLTIMSKLIRGTAPFAGLTAPPLPAWPFDAQGDPRQVPRGDATAMVKVTWAFGAASTLLAPLVAVLATRRRLTAKTDTPAQRKIWVGTLWVNQLAQFPALALQPYVDGTGTTETAGIAVFQFLNWSIQFVPVVLNSYVLLRPPVAVGVIMKESESDFLSAYGLVHLVLYTVQLMYALVAGAGDPANKTWENFLRFFGNMCQTIPEMDTLLGGADPRVMWLNYSAAGVGGAATVIRLGLVIKDQVAFAAH